MQKKNKIQKAFETTEIKAQLVSETPCKKDAKICDLYTQLFNIFNTCFQTKEIDLKRTAECSQTILEILYNFDKQNPEYNLIKILSSQISVIQTYAKEPSTKKYQDVVDSIQFILDYLFRLGECNCREEKSDFKLSEFASLQSSHFYLQAAGSLGNDSTKGIHLRWMLKGGLSNHLPKANYATPGVNFNKANDFVRVYRSKYIESKISIDFTLSPASVDHGTASWVYTSNNEAFHIYFINEAKYTQVVSSINPITNPLDFIIAYGNEVIEIEHKTELSFSVTPYFDSTVNSSISLIELLSVEQNSITSPKISSLRKKYNTVSASGQKLMSENIRSIRFKIQGGHIKGIDFEFYSKFIEVANRKNSWAYLDSYALTKDTNLAHNRLEPVPNLVHGKWRRYNDEAYVNIDNYKERWNGASVPVENRILNTVDTFINLSNNPANPRAIETFLLNDPAASSDPNYNPSNDEFELSNLYILQLAALDFHNARMLGLGTLDIENTIFDGQYIYLSEYVSLGDLEDGLGARKVQHIYCSLPTALSDERLPISVDLKEPVPGIIQGIGTESQTIITDADGYSSDGKTRFLSLFNEDLPDELENQNFYYTNFEFISANSSIPVYAGIEYKRTQDANWQKPELPFDRTYYNIDSTVANAKKNETLSIVIPEPSFPLFVHREKESGWHDYSSYGINWFSRAVSSTVIKPIETTITPANTLQPPTNINAVLIRAESPLLLTSEQEQIEYNALTPADKTFIRLSFEYNHGQDLISYHRTINGDVVSGYSELADANELFGEDFELFFRNRTPISVSGNIATVVTNPNPILVDIQTGDYVLISTGTLNDIISPSIIGDGSNFIGSVLSINGSNYLVHQVDNTGSFPKFTIFKNDSNGFPVALGSTVLPSDLIAPSVNGLFLMVENMLTTTNWSLPDPTVSTTLPSPLTAPLSFKVNIDHTTVFREEITTHIAYGTVETHVQKFRGIYENALIEIEEEDTTGNGIKDTHLGLYKITFTGYNLIQHSQNGTSHRVEWVNGVVRIHSQGQPTGARKDLKVIRTENIGTTNDLIIYVADLTFDANPTYDPIQLGTHKVNYYPGYKTYLFNDSAYNLDESSILPDTGEGYKYSIFGVRTHDHNLGYLSKISQPILMFAQEIVEPEQPRLPIGGLYTTRPDFFGKASYTFTTVYEHKPHSVQFNRASDIQILSTLYKIEETTGAADYNIESVMQDIFGNRKADWFQERWMNLLSWDYSADSGQFEKFPNDASGVRLPMPNNVKFIASINTFITEHNTYYSESVALITVITSLNQTVIPSNANHGALQIVDFMRDIVFNCFVPLTEVPVIYDYIKGGVYKPIPKKQNVRDRNGNLLNPNHADFDMAPMMKVTGTGSPNYETQFTDFGIDGASNAKYFYAVREISMQMKNSLYSPILGPVSLVNTAPPTAPEIVKITPILENNIFSIQPAIEVQINAYSKSQNVKKINIYRAMSTIDALSIRTMTMVNEINVEAANIQDDSIWKLRDEFSDLGYVPYGDPLFYKIVVQREVKYEDKDGNLVTEYAPSEASKLTMTNIVENKNPEAPELSYYSTVPNASHELDTVTLSWAKTVHNGAYTVHKMNNSGNWQQIHEIQTNDALIQIELVNTDLASNILLIENIDGKPIYHHFKIVAKNFAGMISREEKIVTIYNIDTWQDISTI